MCVLPALTQTPTSSASTAEPSCRSSASPSEASCLISVCLLSVSFETSSRSQVLNRAQATTKNKQQQQTGNVCADKINKTTKKQKKHLNGLINTKQQQQQRVEHFCVSFLVLLLLLLLLLRVSFFSLHTKCKWLNFVVIVIISAWCVCRGVAAGGLHNLRRRRRRRRVHKQCKEVRKKHK